jgi:pimeloyl-ACP methyl ester carboxylesterase
MTYGSGGANSELANLLTPHFTIIRYDRRGRGESGDTLPYAVEREIEDIEALILQAGAPASLYGHSSGASLALEAALKLGDKVKKLALYEAPYNSDPEDRHIWGEYIQKLKEYLLAQRHGDAVALFMRFVGMPQGQIDGMRQAPFWGGMEALAPTLAYDHIAVLGEVRSVPGKRAAGLSIPTLVMNGSVSFPFMYDTARELAKAIPHALHRVLEGQTHNVAPEVLAPLLTTFFGA